MAVDKNLDELPEACIARSLSFTSPKEACRLSLVASVFRSAQQSDFVWERFLPTDYRDILARSKEGVELLHSFASKKELYLYLCDHPILIDGATKSFSLEKWSGKKCYMLAAKDLTITWGYTPKHRKWISRRESRFPTVAELLEVRWLETRGRIKTSMLSPNSTYSAYLVFTLKRGTYGFDYPRAEVSVGISGQENQTRVVCLDPKGERRRRHRRETAPTDQEARWPKKRGDGWMEVELGEYFVKEGQDVELDMSLLEVKLLHWKSGLIVEGLIVEGIELRPKGVK